MKSAIFAAGALFASAAIAQPHGHQHQKHHVKGRAEAPMVIVTEYTSTTTTVGVTTTIWVTGGEAAPTPATQPAAPPAASSSVSQVAAQFFEPEKQPPSTAVSVASAPSSAYVAPSPPPATTLATSAIPNTPVAPVAPAPSPPAPEAAAPVVPSPAPVPSAVTTTSAAAVAPTPSSAPVPAASPVSPGSGSSSGALLGDRGGSTVSGGQCTQASPCTGKGTYYETVGTGSCGKEVDGEKVPIIAMPKSFMQQKEGANPNNNPYCNKGVTISYQGKTVNAYVFDKCPGCDGMSIDLSHAAFAALADNYKTIGTAQLSWWFN